RRVRHELRADFLRFLADCNRLHRQAVVFVVRGGVPVLFDRFFDRAGARERIGVLQPDTWIVRILFEVAFEQRDCSRVLLLRKQRLGAFRFFSHVWPYCMARALSSGCASARAWRTRPEWSTGSA